MTVVSPDPQNIIGNVPMKLCVGPTDLTTAFPHGGVALGEIEDAVCHREAPVQVLTAEEFGNEPHAAIAGGEAWSTTFILREYNLEAYSRLFLNATAGAVSGTPLITAPSTNTAGYDYADRAAVFCFSPINLELHPFVVFYAGMPMIQETLELRMQASGSADRFSAAGVIIGTRDGTGRVLKAGRRQDIVL